MTLTAEGSASNGSATQRELDFSRSEFREALIWGLPIPGRVKRLVLATDRLAPIREGSESIADPSVGQLVEAMGCSRRTVFYAIEDVERGCPYLEISRRRGRRDLLTVHWRPIIEDSRPEGATADLHKCKMPPVAQVQECKMQGVQAPSFLDPDLPIQDPSEIQKEDASPLHSVRPRRSKSPDSPEDLAIAESLLALIRERMATCRPAAFDKWPGVVRLMRERDGRSPDAIRLMLEWIFHDPTSWHGWRQNILSPRKLREKWDQMESQRIGGASGQNSSDRGQPYQDFLRKNES
jgi:hypothetical protein